MNKISNKEALVIVVAIADAIIENKEELSKIDAVFGDGDHGINMSKGFTIAKSKLDLDNMDMSAGFDVVSEVLLDEIGGSMGPLYGSFFEGLSDASKGVFDLDLNTLIKMLTSGYENITEISTAKLNDKTLLDVLIPVIDDLKKSQAAEVDFKTALESMLVAIDKNLELSKNLVAKIGRASRFQERTVGYQDAGAMSCAIILKALAQKLIRLVG